MEEATNAVFLTRTQNGDPVSCFSYLLKVPGAGFGGGGTLCKSRISSYGFGFGFSFQLLLAVFPQDEDTQEDGEER